MEARAVKTPDELKYFVTRLIEEYQHDYGTICHAITAAALAAAKAVDASKQGGITGFQAGAIQWMFIEAWMQEVGPKKLLNFRDMLYPQMEERFEKYITLNTWEWLQNQARELLDKEKRSCEEDPDHIPAAPAVVRHWQRIVDGNTVPFDYKIKLSRGEQSTESGISSKPETMGD